VPLNSKVGIVELQTHQKIFLFLAGVLFVGSLGFVVCKQYEISERQEAIEKNMISQRQLEDSITRSQNEYATHDDIKKFAEAQKINLKPIEADLNKLKANLNSINHITLQSNPQVATNVASTSTGEVIETPVFKCNDGKVCLDPNGYLTREQILKLDEKFGTARVPIGSVSFKAWEGKPWSYNIEGRKYQVSTVVGLDDENRPIYYNKFTVDVAGKKYELPITQAETKVLYPESKFHWNNFKLYAGISAGVNINKLMPQATTNLELGFITYGKNKEHPDWTFLNVGGGVSIPTKQLQFVVTPVSFNISKFIPILNNSYIAPSMNVNFKGEFAAMGGIRVEL
jgi:hypothetical protein